MEHFSVDTSSLVSASLSVKQAMDRAEAARQALGYAPAVSAAYPRIPNGQELGAGHDAAVQAIGGVLADVRAALETLVAKLEETARAYESSDQVSSDTVQGAGRGMEGVVQ